MLSFLREGDTKLNRMEEITIYKYQLEAIYDALRITANIHESRNPRKEGGQTCHDRQVKQSEQFAKNALEGNYKKEVPYMG